MYWYMTCRYYGGVDIWYPSLGRQMYRIGSRQYWMGQVIHYRVQVWVLGSPSLTRYGRYLWYTSMVGSKVLQLLHSTRYYMYILYCSPCLETSYNILLHIATGGDTTYTYYYHPYCIMLSNTSTSTHSIYHVLRHSTTYTLVILAIYYWGAPYTILDTTIHIPSNT